LDVAILGTGALGTALAREWAAPDGAFRGRLILWSRTLSHARRLARELRSSRRGRRIRLALARRPEEALASAPTTLVCVAEDALDDLVLELARATPVSSQRVVLHTCGALGLAALAPLARRGLATGKLHPLVAVPPGGGEPGILRGAGFAVQGAPRALRAARAVVRGLCGIELALAPGARAAARYHAAATLLSGGMVALFDVASELAQGAGPSRQQAERALERLARSTLVNLRRGARAALTGPLARGSEQVLLLHLAGLARAPAARELYRALAGRMLELALARGSIDRRTAARLARRLARSG
jgi:predicted short-subunit dehydrogenase-like oxidoreductase (DUF2520 family)